MSMPGKVVSNRLREKSATGKKRPWREFKSKSKKISKNMYLTASKYDPSYKRKADRMDQCGEWLLFSECNNDGFKKLKKANFCDLRLCPICAWRKSNKIFFNFIEVAESIKKDKHDIEYIHLTLTVKNVGAKCLKKEMDNLNYAFQKLTVYKAFSQSVLGWFKSLEVTYNSKRNDYHPHIHTLLAVSKSYFKSKGYIKKTKWIEMWRKAAKLDYDPSIHVEKVKNKNSGEREQGTENEKDISLSKAVAEVAKYSVKFNDLIEQDNLPRLIYELDQALFHRRLVAYGGIIKEYRTKLEKAGKLINEETAVVESTGEDTCPNCQSGLVDVIYKWGIGLTNGDYDYYKNKPINEEFKNLKGKINERT